jgi:hypothetical protein
MSGYPTNQEFRIVHMLLHTKLAVPTQRPNEVAEIVTLV